MARVKINGFPLATTIADNDLAVKGLSTTGVGYRITWLNVVAYLLTKFTYNQAVINPTTSELSQSDLNTAYPDASPGFEVICESIIGNPLMYKKGQSGWYFLPLGTF